MNLDDLNLSFSYKDNLREYPKSASDILIAINRLESWLLEPSLDTHKRIHILGKLGSYSRSMYQLKKAATYLDEALNIIKINDLLGKNLEISNRIRRAHVHHWSEEFYDSTQQFNAIIRECQSNEKIYSYLDFAYQHQAKNLFDQNLISDSILFFRKALKLRKLKNDASLIESTQFALNIAKKKLLVKHSGFNKLY